MALASWLAVKVVFVCSWLCFNLDFVQDRWASSGLTYRGMSREKVKVLDRGSLMHCFYVNLDWTLDSAPQIRTE